MNVQARHGYNPGVNENAPTSKWFPDCALFLALAFALRLGFMLAMPRVLDTADGIHYLAQARHIADANVQALDPRIPVLYPALTAIASCIVPDVEQAATIVSLIASMLLIIPIYALARRMHGRRAARIAALAVAVWPWLIDYASRVGPDALGCTLWFFGAWFLAAGIRSTGWRTLPWLIAAALAYFALHITRAEGTYVAIAAAVAAIALCWRKPWLHWARLATFCALFAALFFANAHYASRVIGNTTAAVRTQDILRDLDLIPLLATAVNTLCEKLPLMLGPALLLFLGLGIFYRGGRDTLNDPPRDLPFEAYLLLLAAAQWFLSLFVLSPGPRYLMAVIITLSLWSARGIAIAAAQAAQLPKHRWLRHAPVLAMVALMSLGTAISLSAEYIKKMPSEPREFKIAGLWMKDNLEPGLIFTRKPQIAYYAQMPSTGPDLNDSLEEALQRAQTVKARYVVIDQRYTTTMVPSLTPLLDPKNAPKNLKHLQSFTQYPKAHITIYELLPPPRTRGD